MAAEQGEPPRFEDLVLRRLDGVELSDRGGTLGVRVEGRRLRFPGLVQADLEFLLGLVDSHRTVREVIAAAASRYAEAEVRQVLWQLCGVVLEPHLPPSVNLDSARVTAQLDLGRPRRSPGSEVRTVGVLGGGTAGLLAALGLRRKLPELEVTVVASSQIPVIGVGEATTPLMPAFLHGTLGLDPQELFERVRPVWKLGIRFDWGRPGSGHFNYPFQRGPLLEALHYSGDFNTYCPASLLMEADRSPLLDAGGGHYELLPAPFAYHLDNRPFVDYLQSVARRSGIRFIDRQVVEARPDTAGEGLAAVLTDAGEEFEFDLWIDASGFASRLLGEALGEPFDPWAGSLPTDAVLLGTVPGSFGGGMPPSAFTTASTMRHGWRWRISLAAEDHIGYVFAQAMTTVAAAESELRAAVPGVGELRLLSFTSGRRRRAWRGNVFALGNAYGFVEPLESTALHMVLVAVTTLVRHFPRRLDEPAGRRLVNQYLGDFWDDLRWFLALHFRFNRRLDSPFWRHCRQHVEIGDAATALALFRESAPLSYRPHLLSFDSLWGDFGRDILLLGQGVEGHLLAPRMSRAEWRRRLGEARQLTERALPLPAALALLDQRPDILRRWARQAPWAQDQAVGGCVGW